MAGRIIIVPKKKAKMDPTTAKMMISMLLLASRRGAMGGRVGTIAGDAEGLDDGESVGEREGAVEGLDVVGDLEGYAVNVVGEREGACVLGRHTQTMGRWPPHKSDWIDK